MLVHRKPAKVGLICGAIGIGITIIVPVVWSILLATGILTIDQSRSVEHAVKYVIPASHLGTPHLGNDWLDLIVMVFGSFFLNGLSYGAVGFIGAELFYTIRRGS